MRRKIDIRNSEVAVCAQCRGAFRRDRRANRQYCSSGCQFWSKVDVGEPDQCWEWKGRVNRGGYGLGIEFKDGRSRLAHRQAWELVNGPISEGLFVLHRCDNRPCCNPQHHFLGTKADNNADMCAKGRDCHSKGTIAHRVVGPGGKLAFCSTSLDFAEVGR